LLLVLQADVFSFAMMLYQLVQRYLTIMAISIKGDPEEVMAYAARVATGYRPPLNNKLPPNVVRIIQVCGRIAS
jgi:mitogen-activated protein kinase kinase kinase 7